MSTQSFVQPKRIMLKLSGEVLKGKEEFGYDMETLSTLVKKIITVANRWIEVVIVLGGGNIFRGSFFEDTVVNPMIADYVWIISTVMNGLILGDAIERQWHKAYVLSSTEMPRIVTSFTMKKALYQLSKGYVLVCSWGTGNPCFTTDTAAVQKALELGCDYVVKATKVDGVYDKDPMKFPDAKRFDTLSLKEAYTLGVNVMDHAAIAMAYDNKMPVMVCHVDDMDKIGTADIRATYVTP